VSDEAIANAVRELLLNTKLLAETAGAAATAAVLSGAIPLARGAHVGVVVSGGNVDVAKLTKTIA
jgi:threonine dehydratase